MNIWNYFLVQVWRFFCGRLVCLDVKDAFCSSLLIYNFRIFERRFGTRKFAVSIKTVKIFFLKLDFYKHDNIVHHVILF